MSTSCVSIILNAFPVPDPVITTPFAQVIFAGPVMLKHVPVAFMLALSVIVPLSVVPHCGVCIVVCSEVVRLTRSVVLW